MKLVVRLPLALLLLLLVAAVATASIAPPTTTVSTNNLLPFWPLWPEIRLTEGGPFSAPLLLRGAQPMVVVGTGRSVVAFDANSGEQQWTVLLNASSRWSPVTCTPVQHGNQIYAIREDGIVFAIPISAPQVAFVFQQMPLSSPSVRIRNCAPTPPVSDWIFFAAKEAEEVLGLHLTSGSTEHLRGASAQTSPESLTGDVRLWTTGSGGAINGYTLSRATVGTTLALTAFAPPVLNPQNRTFTTPSVGEGALFVASEDGLYVVSLQSDGEPSTGGTGILLQFVAMYAGNATQATAIGGAGACGLRDGTLLLVSGASSVPTEAAIMVSAAPLITPVVVMDSTRIVVASADGVLHGLRTSLLQSGAIEPEYRTTLRGVPHPQQRFAVSALGNRSTVYLMTTNGYLYALMPARVDGH